MRQYKDLFFLLFLFWNIVLQADPIVISLGADCQVAGNLRNYHLRFQAYPFDWNRTQSFDSIVKIIQDDFKHWLDPQFLEYKTVRICNTYYDLEFFHDFPAKDGLDERMVEGLERIGGELDPNFLSFLPEIQAKYKRRIDRFNEVLNSNEPVLFIRSYATPRSARKFVKLMKLKYPNLQYKLIVLIGELNYENKSKNFYKYDWDIENVKVIYCHGNNDGNVSNEKWWKDEVWQSIFLYLGLLN